MTRCKNFEVVWALIDYEWPKEAFVTMTQDQGDDKDPFLTTIWFF